MLLIISESADTTLSTLNPILHAWCVAVNMARSNAEALMLGGMKEVHDDKIWLEWLEVGKDDVEVEDSLKQLGRQQLLNKDDELEHDVQLDTQIMNKRSGRY